MALLNLCMQLWHTLVVKGNLSTHQNIEDDSKAPDVDLWTGVLFGLQQLWSRKVQAAAKGLKQALGRKKVAQSEIDNLNIARLTDEYVLDLQVPVHDTVSVAVVQGTRDLASELASLLLLETAVRNDIIQHLPAIHVFEQHVPMVVCPNHIAHAADVRVVQ